MTRRVRRVSRPAAHGAHVALLILATAPSAGAQAAVAWDAAGGASRAPTAGAPSAWTDDGRLGAALRLGGAAGALAVDGTAGLRDGGWHGAARAAGLAVSPAWRGLRVSASAEARLTAPGLPSLLPFGTTGLASAAALTPADARTAGAAQLRLGWARNGAGLWVGADGGWSGGAARTPGATRDTTLPTAALRPRPERVAAGAWQQLGGVVVGVSVGSRGYRAPGTPTTYFTTRVVDGTRLRTDSSLPRPRVFVDTIWRDRADSSRGTPARNRRWSELEARAGWARGRVTLDAAGGLRPRVAGAGSAAWMEGVASVALSARAALVASGGTLPPVPSVRATAATHVTLGVRLAPRALHRPLLPPVVRPVAADFEVRAAPAGTHVFSVRLPGARVVELSGDFTGWKPVALRQVAADRWEIALRVAPGTHRCNVRVDGDRWVAPPGTTAVDDDFNGRVGLIVVP